MVYVEFQRMLLNYLLDDHDVIKFLTHSLTPPLTEEVRSCFYTRDWPQPAFTCSKLTIETLEQGVKYVQS